jgi:hypothetical protein
MTLNFKQFYRACNPGATLDYARPEDRQYYIDFSRVRSGNLIRELKRTITLAEDPTCQLFTGHIGCGKSTELLRLKAELEEQGFHVVYFASSEDLDMGDIDITDILFLIARKITESLTGFGIMVKPGYFGKLFGEIKDFLSSEIDLTAGAEFSLGLAKITAKTKESPNVRRLLRDRLESRTDSIIGSINEEVLKPVIEKLKAAGKAGLVVIVDNLDRIHDTQKTPKRTQPEYIFFDRGDQLKQLKCHTVYTIPLTLMFSNDANMLTSRFGVRPRVLSMVPVRKRDRTPYEEGISLLKQMIMARAFPNLSPEDRLTRVEEVFETAGMLDRLCWISGGHVRNLLGFLFSCFQKEDPPFPQDILDEVIQEFKDDLIKKITPDEWNLLARVVREQSVAGENEHNALLRSMFVFEYQDKKEGVWFGLNPLLEETDRLKS